MFEYLLPVLQSPMVSLQSFCPAISSMIGSSQLQSHSQSQVFGGVGSVKLLDPLDSLFRPCSLRDSCKQAAKALSLPWLSKGV